MSEQGSNGKARVPSPGEAADRCAGVQLATEPIQPLEYAICRVDGQPVYMVAVVMGERNISRMAKMLDRLKQHQDPVTHLPGEDPPAETR